MTLFPNQKVSLTTIFQLLGDFPPGNKIFLYSFYKNKSVVNDTFVSPATFAAGIHSDCAAGWYAAWGYFGRAPRFSLVANRNSTDYGGAESEITSYVTGWFW